MGLEIRKGVRSIGGSGRSSRDKATLLRRRASIVGGTFLSSGPGSSKLTRDARSVCLYVSMNLSDIIRVVDCVEKVASLERVGSLAFEVVCR